MSWCRLDNESLTFATALNMNNALSRFFVCPSDFDCAYYFVDDDNGRGYVIDRDNLVFYTARDF